MTPLEIADAMDKAERMGASKDEPEGVRYIIISDTLAKQWASILRGEEYMRKDVK